MFLFSLNKAWQLCGTERLHPQRRLVTAAEQVSRIKGTSCRLPRRHKMWTSFVLFHLWQWGIYNNSFKDTTISRSYKYLNFSHGVSVSDKQKNERRHQRQTWLTICPWPPKNMPQIKASSSRIKLDPWRRRHYVLSKHQTPSTQWNSTTSQKTWTESSIHQSLPNCV